MKKVPGSVWFGVCSVLVMGGLLGCATKETPVADASPSGGAQTPADAAAATDATVTGDAGAPAALKLTIVGAGK